MKRFGATRYFNLALAVVVVAVVALAGAPAHAATGTTNVSVTLDPLVILYYYNNVSVEFSATDMTKVLGITGDTVVTADSQNGTNVATSGQLAVTPATALTLTPPTGYNANLVLLNNWAVRSIGQSGSGHYTQVAIAIGTATLTNGSNGDEITIGTPGTRVSGSGAFGDNAQFAPTGLGNVQYGDVELPLTLDKATISGAYTGGTYTLTATNI